tara:strand:+ start:1028 stop:1306 length:279 start_codon:yes stop_codon:yes gene_type:complete
MSETQKFTTEELKRITDLRNAHAQKINEFGQIELELLLTSQRMDTLQETKEDLRAQYISLQEQEKELVADFNKKYGQGTVDLESGEFVPKNE